jgi:hypothetical protein
MTGAIPATSLLTYVWHYLVARMLYDELIRPLAHGDAARLLLLALIAMGAFVLGRRARGRA